MNQLKRIITFSLLIVMIFMMVACDTPQDNDDDPIDTKSISLNYTQISIVADSITSSMLVAILVDIDETPVWTSSDVNIATVTPDTNPTAARVRGISAGTATIKVSAGGKEAECIVTVTAGEYLNIINKTISMQVGQTDTINLESHTTNITYQSNNTDIATVNASGVVTAIAEGSAIITVKAGTKTAYVTVNIAQPGIKIEEDEDIVLQFETNPTATLTAKGLGGVNTSLGTWSIEDSTVASISQDGATVTITALESGIGKSTTISFSLGEFPVQSRTVTVKDIDLEIDLDQVFLTMLKDQNEAKLTVTLTPEQTGENAEIIWTTAPEGIIDIAADGTITRHEGYVFTEDEVSIIVTATSKRDPEASIAATVLVESPTKGTKIITNKAEFNTVMSNPANGSATILLAADIDLEGQVYNALIMAAGTFSGHFNGNGYEIKNFSAPGIFGVVTGTIENVSITGIMTGNQRGLIATRTEQTGIIKNIYVDITHTDAPTRDETAAIALFGTAENVIITSRNLKGEAIRTHAGFVQTGTITNVFYWNAQGTVSSKGATLKTEADIKAASTYATGWDLTIWNIVDGQLPTLIKKSI